MSSLLPPEGDMLPTVTTVHIGMMGTEYSEPKEAGGHRHMVS